MLHSVSINNIIPCIICRFGIVISYSYRCLRGEEVGQSPFIRDLDNSCVGHVLAMTPRSAYIIKKKLQPHSQFQSVATVLHHE